MRKTFVLILTLGLLLCWSMAILAGPTLSSRQAAPASNSGNINFSVSNVAPVKAQNTPITVQRIGERATAASNPSLKKDDSAIAPPVDQRVILQGGDNFGSATVISTLPYTDNGTTTGYTNDYDGSCGSTGGPDVVYSYSPVATEIVNVSLCSGTTYDSKLIIYENDSSTQIACNDDFCGLQSEIDYTTMYAGNTYYIVVDGYGSSNGSYGINVTSGGTPPEPPANDECVNATAIIPPYPQTIFGTNNGATVDCPGMLNWNAVWYTIELPYASNQLTIDFAPTCDLGVGGINTVGIVYFYDCACGTYEVFGYAWNNCADGTYYPSLFATIAGPATIYFPAYVGAQIDFAFNINVVEPAAPPPNDNCQDVPIDQLFSGIPLQFTGDNSGATVDCPSLGYAEVWHAFTTSECLDVTIDFCGSPTVFGNYYIVMDTQCPCSGTFVRANDWNFADCGDGNITLHYLGLPPGTYYLPVLSDFAYGLGPYTINVNGATCAPPPPADFSVVAPGSWTGNTCGAVNDCNLRPSEEQIWEVSIPTAGNWIFTLCNTAVPWDSHISLGAASCQDDIAFNDDYCGLLSQITAYLEPGTYYLTVEAYSTACGDYTLDIIGQEPCVLECPPNAIPEGETPCADEYVDTYNGGCNSVPPVFQAINNGDVICGASGNFMFQGLEYRDTDWFRYELTQDATVEWKLIAEFPVLGFIMAGNSEDCADYTILASGSTAECDTLVLTAPATAGPIWLWVGPSVFTGYPCPKNYVASLTTSEPPPPPAGCDNAIYSNGLYGIGANGYSSQCDPIYAFASGVADDFVLSGTGSVDIGTVVSYWTFWNHDPLGTPADMSGIVVTFYADNGGVPGGKPTSGDPNCAHEDIVPGGVIASEVVTPDNFTYVLTADGFWQVEANITPVTLDAGVTYWLEVAPALDFSAAGQSGWVTSESQTGSYALQIFELLGIMEWTAPDVVDAAFCLIAAGGPPPGCSYVPGDVNNSGVFNGIDVTFMVGYFKGGPVPPYSCECTPGNTWYVAGDVNGNCVFNGIDVTYSVGYFKGGAAPRPCPDCPPAVQAAKTVIPLDAGN